jgi:glutamyl-tRNA synthetase
LIWGALDEAREVPIPVFAHLPMLVNEQRKKLSKRRDPVAVESYRDQGYLAEAFRNYLALLGWSPPGEQEKVGLDTLIGAFRLEDVHHAPAFFDVKKLTHLNGEYVRGLSSSEFAVAVKPWVEPAQGEATWSPATGGPLWPPERFDESRFALIAPLVQERVKTLGEVPGMIDFLFLEKPTIDAGSWDKVARDPSSPEIVATAIDLYGRCVWDRDSIEAATHAVAELLGKKPGKIDTPIRVPVTGRTPGPPLFEPLEILGRDEVLTRLRAGLERLTDT